MIQDENTLNGLYESTRCLLLSTENIGNSINELKNVRLKNYLTKVLQCLQSEGLILNDLLFEISSCLDDADIVFLLDCADDSDSLTDETTFQVN